jgi:hypothetical protein
MQITIDGKEESFVIDESEPFGRLLERVKEFLAKRKRVILSLKLDGAVIMAEELSQKKIGQFELLEIQSADPKKLSENTLQELKTLLENLEKTHLWISSQIQKGEILSALPRLVECLKSWQIFFTTIELIGKLLCIRLEEISLGQETLSEALKGLIKHLRDLKNAFDEMDFIRLSDIIEFELKPGLPRWYELVERLKKLIKAEGA